MKFLLIIAIPVGFVVFVFLGGFFLGEMKERNTILKESIANQISAQKMDSEAKTKFTNQENWAELMGKLCQEK